MSKEQRMPVRDVEEGSLVKYQDEYWYVHSTTKKNFYILKNSIERRSIRLKPGYKVLPMFRFTRSGAMIDYFTKQAVKEEARVGVA